MSIELDSRVLIVWLFNAQSQFKLLFVFNVIVVGVVVVGDSVVVVVVVVVIVDVVVHFVNNVVVVVIHFVFVDVMLLISTTTGIRQIVTTHPMSKLNFEGKVITIAI